MPRLRRTLARPALCSGVVALVATVVLYREALALPLFSDDLVQIPWLRSATWADLWTSPSPYGYYRPVWYSLWRLLGAALGGLRPFPLHLVNLVAHGVAASLAGVVASRWIAHGRASGPVPAGGIVGSPPERTLLVAVVAAGLFAVFPFAWQAVAWPGAVYNPVVSAMASGALILYDAGREHGRPSPIVAALALAAVSPLTYEAGVMVAPLLTAAEAIGWRRRRWPRRLSAWPLVGIATTLATLLVWRGVRGSPIGGFGLRAHDLAQNASYLLQGLLYPAAPLAQALSTWAQVDPAVALFLVSVPTSAIVIWSAWRADPAAVFLAAISFAAFSLPPLITMEADWFALAPRFLYMTAGPAALLWSAAISTWCTLLGRRLRFRSIFAPAATLLLGAGLVWPAASYVRHGIGLYRMAGSVIWDAAYAGATTDRALFVNLPRRIAPLARVYPMGYEGITPLPQRVDASDLVTVNTGVAAEAEAVSFGVVAQRPSAAYAYELHGREVGWLELADATLDASTVYLVSYAGYSPVLLEAGGPAPQAARAAQLHPLFEDCIGIASTAATCTESGRVRLDVTWQAVAPIDVDVTVFAHLLDAREPVGPPVAQADGHTLLGMKPFWVYRDGEAVRDVRIFPSAPPGRYDVRVGLWEPANGRRWASEAGQSEGVVVASVTCP